MAYSLFIIDMIIPGPNNELITQSAYIAGYPSTESSTESATVFNTQTSSYTLVLTDAGKTIIMDSGSANTLTIPSSASVNFPTGSQIGWVQMGSGQTSFLITTNELVSRGSASKSTGQYAMGLITKVTETKWVLTGDITA